MNTEAKLICNDVDITENKTKGDGGVIYAVNDSKVEIRNSNSAEVRASVIYMNKSKKFKSVLDNCRIT